MHDVCEECANATVEKMRIFGKNTHLCAIKPTRDKIFFKKTEEIFKKNQIFLLTKLGLDGIILINIGIFVPTGDFWRLFCPRNDPKNENKPSLPLKNAESETKK